MANPTNKSKRPQTVVTQQPKITSSPQSIQTVSQQAGSTPTHEEIAKRAEEIYHQKGCPQGQDEQIWLQAERELRSKKMATSSSR